MDDSKTLGFILSPEMSCYNAVSGLAQALKARGYRVLFFIEMNSAVFIHHIEAQGMLVVPVDFNSCEVSKFSERKVGPKKRFGPFSHSGQFLSRDVLYAKLAKEHSLSALLVDDVRPDVDIAVLAMTRNQIPSVLLSYTYASEADVHVPPIFSGSMAKNRGPHPFSYKFLNAFRWMWTVFSKGYPASFDTAAYIKQSATKVLDVLKDRQVDISLRELGITTAWSEWKRRPSLPAIVFGHEQLDWTPLRHRPRRCYFGTCDLYKSQIDFDWAGVETDRPIIYCNLSTVGDLKFFNSENGTPVPDLSTRRARMAKRYLDAVIEAFTQNPEWQLILACGQFSDGIMQYEVPSNIFVYDRVPQVAVLERADITICWGGAGTVRECVSFGVPMLIYPAWTDQYGNAARILAAGLGLKANITAISASGVCRLVRELLCNKIYLTNMETVNSNINKDIELSNVVAFLEEHTGITP